MIIRSSYDSLKTHCQSRVYKLLLSLLVRV